MSLINTSNFCTLTDLMASVYKQQAAACAGGSGITQVAQDLLTALLGIQDFDTSKDMMDAFKTSASQLTPEGVILACAANQYQGLSRHINRLGASVDASIINIPTYLAYYNRGTGGSSLAVTAEDFSNFYKVNTGNALNTLDVFPVVLSSEQTAPGMGSLTYGGGGDTFTAGVSYAGRGSIRLGNVSNAAKLIVSSAITASGTLTVLITGKNQAGNSGTFNASIVAGSFGLNSQIVITPTTTGDRLTEVDGISFVGTQWTAGVIFIMPVQERAY